MRFYFIYSFCTELTQIKETPKERSDDTVNNLPDTADVPQSPRTSSLEDHSYSIRDIPRGVKRKLTAAMIRVHNLEKSLKTTQQKSCRLKRKVSSLQEIVITLQKKNLVSANGAKMLSSFSLSQVFQQP